MAYFNLTGLGYSSYENLYNSSGALLADAQDLLTGGGNLILSANGLTFSDSSSGESVKYGSDVFAIQPHASETVSASGMTGETFVYGAGFGQSSITGFLATGSTHDVLQFNVSSFNYLNSSLTQGQDVTALLAAAVSSGSNLTIPDSQGDSLTLIGVTKAVLSANAGDFKFV